MSASYVSIFDGVNSITEKKLHRFFNLNRERKHFTNKEIVKAYHQRAHRFHPDTQARFQGQAFPREICNALMSDIVRAKDLLLKGNERGNTIGFDVVDAHFLQSLTTSFKNQKWVDCAIDLLRMFESKPDAVAAMVAWLSYASSNVWAAIKLSTFEDGKLNLRYINEYSDELHILKDLLAQVDSKTMLSLLEALKKMVDSRERVLAEDIMDVFDATLPFSMKSHERYPELLAALDHSSQALQASINDNFVRNMTETLRFWPDLMHSLPSWTLLISVLSATTVITGTSLPRVAGALIVAQSVVLKQKGLLPFLLSVFPLTFYVAILFTLGFLTQVSANLTLLALTTSIDIFSSLKQLSMAIADLLVVIATFDFKGLAYAGLQVFEACFDLTIRVTFNMTMRTLNWGLFFISDYVLLDDLISIVNTGMNAFFEMISSTLVPDNKKSLDEANAFEREAGPEAPDDKKTVSEMKTSGAKSAFYQPAKLFNDDDVFLTELLDLMQNYDNTAPTYT